MKRWNASMLVLAGLCVVAAGVVFLVGVAAVGTLSMYVMHGSSTLAREGVVDLDQWAKAPSAFGEYGIRGLDDAMGARTVRVLSRSAIAFMYLPLGMAVVLVWFARPSTRARSRAGPLAMLGCGSLFLCAVLMFNLLEFTKSSGSFLFAYWSDVERSGALHVNKLKQLGPEWTPSELTARGMSDWAGARLAPWATGLQMSCIACGVIGGVALVGSAIASVRHTRERARTTA